MQAGDEPFQLILVDVFAELCLEWVNAFEGMMTHVSIVNDRFEKVNMLFLEMFF
jgi:hypothetical protein